MSFQIPCSCYQSEVCYFALFKLPVIRYKLPSCAGASRTLTVTDTFKAKKISQLPQISVTLRTLESHEMKVMIILQQLTSVFLLELWLHG